MNVTKCKPGPRFEQAKGGGSCGGPAFISHQDHSARFIQVASWKYDPKRVNVLVKHQPFKGNTDGKTN
jgi:hypothetical protein